MDTLAGVIKIVINDRQRRPVRCRRTIPISPGSRTRSLCGRASTCREATGNTLRSGSDAYTSAIERWVDAVPASDGGWRVSGDEEDDHDRDHRGAEDGSSEAPLHDRVFR